MMTLKRFLAGALLACLLPWSGLGEKTAAPGEKEPADYLTPYAELYMLPVEPQALAQPQEVFDPATVEVEGITVDFLQLVSDGSWILTCAAGASDEVLILPGAAMLDRPAWGGRFPLQKRRTTVPSGNWQKTPARKCGAYMSIWKNLTRPGSISWITASKRNGQSCIAGAACRNLSPNPQLFIGQFKCIPLTWKLEN